MIFTIDEIHLIHSEAIRAGLHNARNHLLFGISIEYQAKLKTNNTPADQLLWDLDAMNSVGALAEQVPLERWLRNAAYATRLFPCQKFFADHAEAAAQKARADAASWIPASLRNIKILPSAGPLPQPGATVSRGPNLDAAQKEDLARHIAGALTPDDLDRILLKCFSNTRVRTVGPNPQQSMPEIAPQCIELVEREKLTTVFLGFVLAVPNCTTELRQTAVSMFPELATVGLPFAKIVDSLAGCLASNIRLIAEKVTDKAPVKELTASVKELKCYKVLHEAIHQVKMSPPPEVPDDIDPALERRFRKDLSKYRVLLTTARIRAGDALGELPSDSLVVKTETNWVNTLGDCTAQIDVALKQADIGAAELALAVTARIVDPLLRQLNERIFQLSIGLLDRLVEALWTTKLPAQQAQDDPIDDVIETMAALRLALLTRVLEHTRWQETDDALFSLEGNFKLDATAAFTKFARQWLQVRPQIQRLSGSDAGQMRALLGMIDEIDHALARIEKSLVATPAQPDIFSAMMSDPYSALRSGTQEMFFNIDSALKRNCNDLVRIEQPLILITTEIG